MASFTFRVEGDTAVIAQLGRVPAGVRREVANTIKRLQYALVNAIRATYLTAGLHSRTGGLIGSIQPGTFEEGDAEIRGTVVVGGGDVNYARAQEYGATIEAKNVQFLTIPLDAAKTGMGVGRWSARTIISDPSQGGFTGTFFKHNVLFGREAGNDVPVPLFALRRSVTLPSRAFVRPAVNEMLPEIRSQLEQAVQRGTV
jgi:hypothetical protein